MREACEVPYESMVGLMDQTVVVAGATAEGGFVVPLRVVHVSLPTHRGRMRAFTADLVGPGGTALSEAGRYPTRVGGRRFDITLSWVRVLPEATFCRATFVHRLPRASDPVVRWGRTDPRNATPGAGGAT